MNPGSVYSYFLLLLLQAGWRWADAQAPLSIKEIGIRLSLLQNVLGKGQEDQISAALYGHEGGRPALKPAREDFVVTIPTHQSQQGRVLASRASRLGMRTFVATNYTPGIQSPGPVRYPEFTNETWTFYPDDNPARSYSAGDTKVALMPFLAYKHYAQMGTANFKWLFMGDDDTLFFVDAGREVVASLDPEMPIFLTDNAWFSTSQGTYHPHKDALRCLPCNYARNTSALPMKMVRGCPCTPEVMCSLKDGYNQIINSKACGPPRSPSISYSMHGGSGALFSIGLLRKIPFEKMEECALSQWNSGADAYLTICLWQLGYAITDPNPLYHPDGLVMFDPAPVPYNVDENIIPKTAYILGNLLRQLLNLCSGLCQLEFNHTISLHLRGARLGGQFQTSRGPEIAVQAALRAVARSYATFTGSLKPGHDLTWLQDVLDSTQAKVAKHVDARLAAGLQLMKSMSLLFDDNSSVSRSVDEEVGPLLSVTTAAVAPGIMDKARSGAATAVAKQVLEIILTDVKMTESFEAMKL